MEAARHLLTAPIVAAALVWLPWVLWAIVKTYLLNDADSKFGAEGGVVFVAGIWGAMAIVAAITCLVVQLTWQTIRGPANRRVLWIWAIGCGVILSVLSRFLFKLPPLGTALFGDIGAIVAAWVVVCALVQVTGVAIANSLAT